MLKRNFWALGLFLVVLFSPSLSAALQLGAPAPPIQGETLSGAHFDLSAFKGEPVLLKVGTTWCGTCRLQGMEISQLTGYLKKNGIHYVDVFVQQTKPMVNKYFKYLKKINQPLPEVVLIDDGKIAKELNIFLIPRVILLDKDHKVYRDGEAISSQDLKSALQAMLNHQ